MVDDISAPKKPVNEDERKKITPLMRFLATVNTDELFDFLQIVNVKWTFRRTGPRNHQMEIWSDGGFRCTGQGESPKSALTNAIAKFFVSETRDYHELSRD